MPELTDAQVLRRAQALLRERGWNHDNGWLGPDGRLCVGAAIGVALGMPERPTAIFDDQARWDDGTGPVLWNRYTALYALLSDKYLDGESGRDGLYQFNDTPGRTLDEVLALLEGAAMDLEGEGRGEATGDSGEQGPDHHGGGG